MKIMITGANGFLGQHLSLYLSKKGFNVIATGRGENRIPLSSGFTYTSIDLVDKKQVMEGVASYQPDLIIHTAAMSKPDECDINKDACILHNVTATQYLLDASQNSKTHFIYVSTDFIFGEGGPNSEDTIPEPLNFYGESKLMAEQLVKVSGLPYSIMRPVFIYGPSWPGLRPSFLHWVKNNLEHNKKIKVVSDQRRTPTYVYDLCSGLETMIHQKKGEVFHLAGKDILSPYQMAVTVANVLQLDNSLIENVTSGTFPEPVRRAKHSGLKIEKAKNELKYNPVSFEEGVRLTFGI